MAKPRRTTKQSQSKQTGGTFLGIVLGLIVGLAIAVVVALYITRAPTPFVSKVAPPAAPDTGASQAQQYDPNRPLQGKTPGQPVPQAAPVSQGTDQHDAVEAAGVRRVGADRRHGRTTLGNGGG